MSRRYTHTPAQSGYSLIMAIIVLVFLSLLAATTLQTVATDTDVAGNSRSSQSALYIAQAGVAWGTVTLRASPFDLDLPTTTVNSVLGSGSLTLVNDETSPLNGWHELPGSPVSYAGGTYRVAINDDIDFTDTGDTTLLTIDTNNTFLLRSLGVDAKGSRRLLEVALSAQ